MDKYLKEILDKADLNLTEKQIQDLERFKSLVLEWNKKFNLTSITESDDFNMKHLLDSLYLLKSEELLNGKNIVDVGTGGGFPGIPLKIALPESNFTLVDSTNKKIRFLNTAIEELNLKKITPIHSRSEELARDESYRDFFDICLSRAVASLDTLVEWCLPLVKPGGYFIAMKGSRAEEEVREAKNAIKELKGIVFRQKSYTLSENDHERQMVVIKKIDRTPEKYPRPAGKARTNPL